MHKCKFCGRRYSGRGVFPSSWGIVRKMAWGGTSVEAGTETEYDRIYCSEKCRVEAEGGTGGGGGDNESESVSESSSSGELPSGCVKIVGMILAFLVVCGILGTLFCKNEDASDPAVKMAKWEEHLEKRRAAFAEGLTEEGVEARGLKNYTWEEWQNRDQSQNKKPVEKEVKKESKSLTDLWFEYSEYRRELSASGYSEEQIDGMGVVALGFNEFKAKYKDKNAEEELKKLKERVEAFRSARTRNSNNPTRQSSTAVPKVEKPRSSVQPGVGKPMVEKPKPAANRNVDKAKLATQRRSVQQKAGGRNPVALGSGNSAVSERSNNTGNKASKDSAGIAITVKGKGKTKDAAVRRAVREAVWRTVGTWVGSKERIKENHDKVVEIVKSITPSDVRKFEILESHNEDGDIVIKVKVHVSKKKIAPKFASVFPDVFGKGNN